MSAQRLPWDQQAAGLLVEPAHRVGVSPNQVTAISLIGALVASMLFAVGGPFVHWAAGIFLVSRFLDHLDGELARRTGTGSRFGHIFDAVTGSISYAALFAGVGIGLWRDGHGFWTVLAGFAIAAPVFINMLFQFRAERLSGSPPRPYPRWGPVELEDAIYLMGPIVWFGGLYWFFIAGWTGTVIACALGTHTLVTRDRKAQSESTH